MNGVLENWGVALAGKLLDWGVGKLSGPRGTTPGERAEQIDKMLESLGSEPEVGQHAARPPTAAAERQNPGAPAPAATIPTETVETAPEKGDIATACVPCALGHFATSSGLLNECFRFKKDGITSNEILDRVAQVLAEQNALERVDLTPEKLQQSPPWERELAEEALDESRRLRHVLEGLESIDQLEGAAADAAAFYRKLNREWFKRRFSQRGDRADVLAENISEEPG